MPRTSSSGDCSASSNARVSSMPGSVSIITADGRRETADGAVTDTRLRGGNLLCNGLAQLRELGRSAKAENPLDDPSLAIEQYRIRQAAVVVDPFHAAAPHENRERRVELVHEPLHLAAIDVVRNRNDAEVLRRQDA